MSSNAEVQASVAAQTAVAEANQRLRAGDFAGACAAAQRALDIAPDDAEAQYLLAVANRYRKAYPDALAAVAALKRASPGYGRAFQEEGHILRATGDDAGARQAYEHAVALNPALTASWRALADIHDDPAAADRARAHAQRLAALPPELVSVNSFMHEGKLYKAERLCRAYLQKRPNDVEAMRLLANLGARLGVYDDAEFLLESALEFQPDFLLARIDYVDVLQKRQKFTRALAEARAVLAVDPDNPAFQTMVANQCAAVGLYDEALSIYDAALSRLGPNPHVHLARGHALKTIGRQTDAIAAYRAAATMKADLGDAYWSLANLKTFRFEDDELARMEAAEAAQTTQEDDRIHLCFALGKAHEDRQSFEASFAYYQRGNALKRAKLRYDADRMDADFARQKAVCDTDYFAGLSGGGHPAPDPIFIVGLPRAGSTLVEQILASHSQVDGTLELPNILALAHRLNGRRRVDEEPLYPAVLTDLSEEQRAKLGAEFIADTRVHRKNAPFFTDKMPNNFRHIGLILSILPNAKIIDARREATACCFAGFKQLFAEGQEFTYDLEDVARYYRGYVDLMDHWERMAPGKILRVQYEEVVADLETQVRRLLEFCALDFEAACVDFHKTKRDVRTASSEQVRQPIFTSGVEQWRNYEPWLEPLKRALAAA